MSAKIKLEYLTIEEYRQMGLIVGLEIHQQLDTKKKLFCRCPAVLRNDEPDAVILRHMRPTLSELGEYDGTALMEFRTKKQVYYQLYRDTVCTYEMDDTPPFPINQEALDIALIISMLLKCKIVDELHVSRKQYLDGSIPTGFQRTAIVGVDGAVDLNGREVEVIQLSVEEDACREVSDKEHEIIFKTDRLSIPLVEVVTKATTLHPLDVETLADRIGRLMRNTGEVRRGIGSVRQDVNVSISGGRRVEIKGVCKLEDIPALVHYEALRQKELLSIAKDLHEKNLDPEDVVQRLETFETGEGCSYTPLRLNGLADIMARELQPGKDFAYELAERARVVACLPGPPYLLWDGEHPGFNDAEWNKTRHDFGLDENDALILFMGKGDDPETACVEVEERVKLLFKGVPNETRQANADGTTGFERVLPGPNRMYPDTDSAPIEINDSRLAKLEKRLPREPSSIIADMTKKGVPQMIAERMVVSPFMELYLSGVKKGLEPKHLSFFLMEDVKGLKRKHPDKGALDVASTVLNLRTSDRIHRSAMTDVARAMFEGKDADQVLVENPKLANEEIEELAKAFFEPSEVDGAKAGDLFVFIKEKNGFNFSAETVLDAFKSKV